MEQLEAILGAKPKLPRTPLGCPVPFVEFEFEETLPADLGPFEEYCRQNKLRVSRYRRQWYSNAEIEATEFFFLADETIHNNTSASATQYTRAGVCPNCGVGLRPTEPLILKFDRRTTKKMFCVDLMQSIAWIIAAELSELFKDFSGFHFGAVCAPEGSKQTPLDLKRIVIEDYLPRMATITNFQEYDPPMKNRCSCNRAGWRLSDETIYERSALRDAKDFNLTVERWYGGGIAGLNWPIVSQRVRRVILDNKLLRPGCFRPVRIIERDPGTQHKFDLPLDTPVQQ
ncbi:MAG TPA: hypothetical protein VMV72_11295 [Verrucomicrobiae bacterium]|nr:hypothetical protein [Verrucomicrobiae bacterium]